MASIERTAYPLFKRNPVVRELIAAYTPTDPEIAFVVDQARQPGHRLTLATYLKCFQRLGYFPSFDEVPASVVRHLRGAMSYRVQINPAVIGEATRFRYFRKILRYLDVRSYSDGGLGLAAHAMREAAATMDNPADVINAAIEQLVRDRVELPAFATLDRLARRVRTLVNGVYFRRIASRLSDDEKRQLDSLLVREETAKKSPLQAIKRLPKRASLQHFQDLLDHIAELDNLVGKPEYLAEVPDLKRKHFAAEAKALDATELRDFRPEKTPRAVALPDPPHTPPPARRLSRSCSPDAGRSHRVRPRCRSRPAPSISAPGTNSARRCCESRATLHWPYRSLLEEQRHGEERCPRHARPAIAQ